MKLPDGTFPVAHVHSTLVGSSPGQAADNWRVYESTLRLIDQGIGQIKNKLTDSRLLVFYLNALSTGAKSENSSLAPPASARSLLESSGKSLGSACNSPSNWSNGGGGGGWNRAGLGHLVTPTGPKYKSHSLSTRPDTKNLSGSHVRVGKGGGTMPCMCSY